MSNILLSSDAYKMTHFDMYPEGTTEVYSYMCSRGTRVEGVDKIVFFGLQYLIKEYLVKPIEASDKEQFVKYVRQMLGEDAVSPKILHDIDQMIAWGYLPLEIKALPEGSLVSKNVAMFTIRNTHKDFAWLTNFVETLLSKCFNTNTAATTSLRLARLSKQYSDLTCDNEDHLPFQFVDFSCRGMSSCESSAMTGAAHLLFFKGSDTVCALPFLDKYYGGSEGYSCRATEHSVVCSYGRDNEFESYERLIKKYPNGTLSLVSDTYDYYNVIIDFLPRLKSQILARNGKVVIRPDSSPKTPLEIVCGDPDARYDSGEWVGSLELLWDIFGGTVNSKGYRVLDPHIGLIYGDAISYHMADSILAKMSSMKFASSNIVFGAGSWTFQYITRDTYQHAIKASSVVVNGERRDIFKDPKTGSFKKSAKGLLTVYNEDGTYFMVDQCSPEEESSGLLKVVFRNGVLYNEQNFFEIRDRLHEQEI